MATSVKTLYDKYKSNGGKSTFAAFRNTYTKKAAAKANKPARKTKTKAELEKARKLRLWKPRIKKYKV